MLPSKERYILRERIPATGELLKYPTKKIKVVAKVVCERCNNTWMSRLEDEHLKPAIENLLFSENRTTLTAKEIVAISAFAFKTLILANHKDLTSAPFFPRVQRFRFRRELRIPDGVQIWMASRKALAGKYYGFWRSAGGGVNEKSPYSFRLYSCTWNFQNIVLQALGTKWDNSTQRKNEPPSLSPSSEWERAAVLIWPPRGNLIFWPPPFYLGDNTIEAFTDRWNEFRITIRAV